MSATMTPDATLALVQEFETAFNRHDVDALMAAMTEDSVFEIVAPAERGGGRCAYRWSMRWDLADGGRGHLRGIDAFTLRDGKFARTSTYFAL